MEGERILEIERITQGERSRIMEGWEDYGEVGRIIEGERIVLLSVS